MVEQEEIREGIEIRQSAAQRRRSFGIDVRIPTEEEILENPRRAEFMSGGWIDTADPRRICLYWHRRQDHFTVYSLLQILEHEILHAVLINLVGLDASIKLDNVHRSSFAWTEMEKLVSVNEFKVIEWVFPPYLDDPAPDMME